MDKKIYVITQCGNIEAIFEDEQQAREDYSHRCAFERQFSAPIFPDLEETTRAEFICSRICGKYEETIRHNAASMSERTGEDKGWCYNHIWATQYCRKCVLRDRSPYCQKDKGDHND